jgi:hypothetical protein
MVAGRSTESKSAAVTKVSGSAAVTAPAGTFTEEDAGRGITGTGIPAGTTVLSVQSGTAATLSANATATNSATATLAAASGQSYGFVGWSPESDDESETYTVAANNAGTVTPDRVTSSTSRVPPHRTRG